MDGPLGDLKARGEGCNSIGAAIFFLYVVGFYFSLSSYVQYRADGGHQWIRHRVYMVLRRLTRRRHPRVGADVSTP